MKKLLLTALTLAGLYSITRAQDMTPEQQKAYMTYAMPGEVQSMLAKYDGKWKEEMTMWMKPGAPPMTNTLTGVNEMILGGRYQRTTHTGNFMGMPFTGESITGYDNARKVFFSTWIDNMGTGFTYFEGNWVIPHKKMELKGKMTNPLTGKDMPVREVVTFIDDNTQLLEMYLTEDGTEYKNMEIKITRS